MRGTASAVQKCALLLTEAQASTTARTRSLSAASFGMALLIYGARVPQDHVRVLVRGSVTAVIH